MEIKDQVKNEVETIRPAMEQARKLMQEMMDYPKKTDKSFYLGAEDELTVIYDDLLEKYLTVKLIAETNEANTFLATKKRYEGGTVKITVKDLECETASECAEVFTSMILLESWFKSVKNALQTCRSHISAITGKEEDGDGND
jgi:hypothetical protein